jgi:dihydroorotase
MNLLIRQVTIADPNSALNGKLVDVLVKDGKFAKIATKMSDADIPAGVEEKNGKGCYLSPGWFDMKVNFREPGYEQKETIVSGQQSAARGGFTGVLIMPSVKPAIQTRSDVEYVLNKSKSFPVEVFTAGSITVNREGKDLAEMFDMKQGGAVIFTDDKRAITNSGLMMRALQYAGNIGTKLIAYADDPAITGEPLANESTVTTTLGFKGSPSFAEAVMLERDVRLMEHTGQPLHVSGISTAEAIEVVRMAKKMGLPITAEAYAYHLLLDDSSLEGFDSNYKVKPPLRSISDRELLCEAIADGTIDVVVSDHSPEDIESKDVEFDYAAYGMIGLESTYSVVKKAMEGKMSPEFTAKLMAINPREILGLEIPSIAEGAVANFTIFNPDEKYIFGKSDIKSKSRNTPFIDSAFEGKVKMTYNKQVLYDNLV